MATTKISSWVQNGANIGIFAGLILVALQMQQNSQLLRMQLLIEETNSYIAGEMAIAGEGFTDVWQKMLEEPENLSLSEMRVVESDIWGHAVYRWWGTYRLYDLGLVDAKEWQDQVDVDARFTFGNPYARAWWDSYRVNGSGVLPQELSDYIDSKVKNLSLDGTAEYFNQVQENLGKYQAVPGE